MHVGFGGKRKNKIWLGYSRRIRVRVGDSKNTFITQISYKIEYNQKKLLNLKLFKRACIKNNRRNIILNQYIKKKNRFVIITMKKINILKTIYTLLLPLESKGWRSGESAHLPPMWPGFKSQL